MQLWSSSLREKVENPLSGMDVNLVSRWLMVRDIGGVERGAAQLELQQREMKSCKKTNGHNHHEDVLVDLATNLVENKDVASKLPTFSSLKSSLY